MKFKFEDVKDAVIAIAGNALIDDGIVLSYKTKEEAITTLDGKKLLSTDQKRTNLEKIGLNGFFCYQMDDDECMYCSADEFVRIFEKDGIIMALANRIISHGRTFVKKKNIFSEEFIRSNLVVQLIENAPEFKATIEEAGLPGEYFGMKVVTRLVIDNNEEAGVLQTCVLPKEAIESVIPGVTREDILSMAEQNLKRVFKPIAKPLKENSFTTSIYMVGCPLFGASLILFPELLKDITKDLGVTFLSMISYNTDSWIAVTNTNSFLTKFLTEEELIEASSGALQKISIEMFASPKSNPVSKNVFVYKRETNSVEIKANPFLEGEI